MKTLSFSTIVLLLVFLNANSQSPKKFNSDVSLGSLQKATSNINAYEFKHRKQLIVLAKLEGRKQLVKIKGDDFPDNTVFIYSILKDSTGRIIAIEQVPYSQSGDWYEEFKHYFDEDGNTFAFTTRTTVFDDSVKGGVAMCLSSNYYSADLHLISHINRLTDSKEKPLKGRKSTEFDFRNDPYKVYRSVNDCLKAYNIDKVKF
jgi:hypothetical protein